MTEQTGFTPAAVIAFAAGDMENFIAASTPGGIEAQEAAGQHTFVANSTLPIEILCSSRRALELMGIAFGENADDLFVNVTLPEGWTKRKTDHSMWSEVLDNLGRPRIAVFYKAAFYDRKAHMQLIPRYTYSAYNACNEKGDSVDRDAVTHFKVVLRDAGQEIKVFGIWEKSDYESSYRIEAEAMSWLNENYPEWQNPMAYWD